jgi:multidrug efflux pump subunit AcrA (membrane-fusion protein)
MYASVRIPLHSAQNALALPIQAVHTTDASSGTVLIVDGSNRLEKRDVTLGLQTSNFVEILSGVTENQLVVFGEQDQYKAGQTIKPKSLKATDLE